MAFGANIRFISPLMRSMVGNSYKTCPISTRAAYSCLANQSKFISAMSGPQLSSRYQNRQISSDPKAFLNEKPLPLAQALENEIQEELAEFNQQPASEEFPGFAVETDDADVKLTRQVGDTTVVVRFTVSSSLSEWRAPSEKSQNQDPQSVEYMFKLISLPDFQVQIIRNGRTFEVSCFYEERDVDDETSQSDQTEPIFEVDEVVMYEGEPKETEFAVSIEYFGGELVDSLVQYLADLGIDQEFSKNLVTFATKYERKKYIGFMKRLKEFVSK